MEIKVNGEKVKVTDKPEKVHLYFRESAIQSIIADTYMFGILFGGLILNHLYLDSRWYIDIFFLMLILTIAAGKSSKRWEEFTSLEELKKFVREIKE